MKTTVHKLEKEDLLNALDALCEEDRNKILDLAKSVDKEIKSRGPYKIMFGHWSARELLAKLGIFMNKRD